MKIYWCIGLFFLPIAVSAQQYALLDQYMVQPVSYTNAVTMQHQQHKKFPVEVTHLHGFYKILLKIRKKLTHPVAAPAEHYALGCVSVTGKPVSLVQGSTWDYVATFHCEEVKFYLHLSNASFDNETNLFVINSWIRYLKRNTIEE